MKKMNLAFLIITSALMVLVFANCGSNDGDSNGDRTECAQATDCGEGGRNEWLCRDGYCYTIAEFCSTDEECVGSCVNHTCTGGKVVDEEEPPLDGDDDTMEQELEPEQVPCEYQCCTDLDCGENAFCDQTKHECVVKVTCDPEKECCQDYDCESNPLFGDGYICRLNICVDENSPCPYECCENSDCPNGFICLKNEADDTYFCKQNTFACTPGAKVCCMNDPGNPDCNALDELKTEAILTCNAAGDNYDLTYCPEFNDCRPDSAGTNVTCEPNGRCGVTDDCTCPNQCLDTPNGKKCMLPAQLQEGEKCAEKACGSDEPVMIGSCDGGLVCMVDQESGDGTCEVDSGKK